MKVLHATLGAVSFLSLLAACEPDVLEVDAVSPTTGGASTGGQGGKGSGGSQSATGGASTGGQSSDGGAAGEAGTGGQYTGPMEVPPQVYSGYSESIAAFGAPDSPDGLDDIVLTYSQVSSEDPTIDGGTIVFGTGNPPPVEDPTAWWPGEDPLGSGASLQLISGYVYPLFNIRKAEGRFQFDIKPAEAYADWCEAQTSIPQPEGTSEPYSCIPYKDGGLDCSGGDYSACVTNYPDQPDVTLSHALWAMCGSNICTCTADGCAANLEETMSFDLRYEEDIEQLNDVSGGTYLTRVVE